MALAYQWPHSYSSKGLRAFPSYLARQARTTSRPSPTRPAMIMWEAAWYSMPVQTSLEYTKGREGMPPRGQEHSSSPPSDPLA